MAKKILALVLAVLMIAALSVSAFATTSDEDEGKGSIWVKNPQDGEEYNAYKIFDVTYDSNVDDKPAHPEDHYSYTIADDSPWYAVVAEYAADAANGMTLTHVANTDAPKKYVVRVNDSFSAPNFAQTLKSALDAGDVEDTPTPLSGKTSVEPLGYWFVTTKIGTLCNLTTTNPEVEIYDKNEKPTITKTAEDTDKVVEVGQVLDYTLRFPLPKDVTGYTDYEYKLSDAEMPDGLTYKYIKSVTIGDTTFGRNPELPGTVHFTQTGDFQVTDPALSATNGFAFSVNLAEVNSDGNLVWKDYLGKDAVVVYTALVDSDAISRQSEKNTASLEYSINPNSSGETETITASDTVYSVNINVHKVGSDGSTSLGDLSGADFVLYKDGDTKQYYKWDDTNKKVTWIPLSDGANKWENCTVVTSSDGGMTPSFEGLDLNGETGTGVYYLQEIKSPVGYALPKDPFAVEITKNSDGTFTAKVGGSDATVEPKDNTVTGTIVNIPGQKLPETGGIGTTIFYVLGSIFVVGAAVVLLTKKRA